MIGFGHHYFFILNGLHDKLQLIDYQKVNQAHNDQNTQSTDEHKLFTDPFTTKNDVGIVVFKILLAIDIAN